MKRVISNKFKDLKLNVELNLVEACDGLECVIGLYLATTHQIKINGIISDETMKYMSGSYSSKIIHELVKNGIFPDVPMFISTALSHTNIENKYSAVVKRIYSKPIDKINASDIIENLNLPSL